MKPLSQVQQAALKQINMDARFLYSLLQFQGRFDSNYFTMSLPYMGIFVDGSAKWGAKVGLDLPVLTDDEKKYYETMRTAAKIFDNSYDDLCFLLRRRFDESDKHFSDICKPIAKVLKLYDNVGVDVNGSIFCGNTILCSIYTPLFSFNADDGEYRKNISIIAGKLVASYGVQKGSAYCYDEQAHFTYRDYHFFSRCPLKRRSFDDFSLFSVLCMINYLIYFVDKLFVEEFSSKLRFAYLQYYYLFQLVSEINSRLSTSFELCDRWYSRDFRNCMAHYGLGQVMSDSDIVSDDLLGGLTQKVFSASYYEVKTGIYSALMELSKQLEDYILK